MSLALRIALLVAGAVFIAGMATAAAAIVVGRDAIRDATLAATSAGAEATGRALERTLVEDRDALALLAALPDLRTAWTPASRMAEPDEATGIRFVLGRVGIGERFDFAALVRPDGELFLVEPSTLQAGIARTDIAYLSWFDELRSTDQVLSNVHVSTVTHQTSVALGVAVRDTDGTLRGYIVGGLRVEGLSSLVAAGTGGHFAYLTDARGLVVAHGRDPRFAATHSDFTSVPAVRLALAGGNGALEDHNPIESEDRIVGYRSLPNLGWVVVYAVPADIAYRPAWSLASTIALSTFVLVAITATVAMLLARRSMAPIVRLSAAAAHLTAGDRSIPLPAAGTDEVGRLAGDFRHMVVAVDAREAELRSRADELLAANRELEAFTYSVSHDLRAPLRSIDGFGRILLNEHASTLDADGRRLLGRVIRSTTQMGALIDGLLALAHAGRREPEMRPVSMTSLVRAVLADLVDRPLTPVVDVSVPDLADAVGDPALVRQVWTNLLGNALKFTRGVDSPCVQIWSESGPAEVRYFIRDNGAGFEPAYVDKLFQPFQRLHTLDQFEGTGIGLAIVARIVRRHGGRVWAEGEPGRGATFAFALPVPKEDP